MVQRREQMVQRRESVLWGHRTFLVFNLQAHSSFTVLQHSPSCVGSSMTGEAYGLVKDTSNLSQYCHLVYCGECLYVVFTY